MEWQCIASALAWESTCRHLTDMSSDNKYHNIYVSTLYITIPHYTCVTLCQNKTEASRQSERRRIAHDTALLRAIGFLTICVFIDTTAAFSEGMLNFSSSTHKHQFNVSSVWTDMGWEFTAQAYIEDYPVLLRFMLTLLVSTGHSETHALSLYTCRI